MEIKKFNEFNDNEINEGFVDGLKNIWNKIVDFFSSEDTKVIKMLKNTESEEEKKEILNDHIESLAKKYIKEVKKDDKGIFYILDLSTRLFKFLDIYKKLTGKKHPRDNWRSEFLGGHFVWKELVKIKDPDKIERNFKRKIENLKASQKEELRNLQEEYEKFKNMIDN